MPDAGEQKQNVEDDRDAERGAESGRDCWRLGGEPLVDDGGGDLFEARVAQHRDLLTEVGLGKEFLNGLLALDGFGVSCGAQEIVREATLAERGADGGQESEEGVRPEDVEVAHVKVICNAALLAGFEACAVRLDGNSAGACEVALVEFEQPVVVCDLRLQMKKIGE